jgi:hypothetical protein
MEKNSDPDLQAGQEQGGAHNNTEEHIEVPEGPRQVSLENNIDPALAGFGNPMTLPWDAGAQFSQLDNGSNSTVQHSDGQTEFEGIDMLAGLFDMAQDSFLSHTQWYGVSSQQTSPEQSVDMTQFGWNPSESFKYNDLILDLPRPTGSEISAKPAEYLPVIVERHQDQPNTDIAPGDLRASVLDDLKMYLLPAELSELDFPRTRVLQKCLRSYIRSFHCHLPILHLTQILGSDTPSPLRLAICSIGALYLVDRKNAALFKSLATKALQNVSIHLYRKSARHADLLVLRG